MLFRSPLKGFILILWIGFMYLATVINEWTATDIPSPFLFELAHVIIHALGFAILALLVIWAAEKSEKMLLAILFAALIVGLGQEVIQSVMRSAINPGLSLFDLLVDSVGAMLGMGVMNLLIMRKRRRDDA